MVTIISVLHVCVCFFLVGVILLQQGKGADAGATLGGGANTLFGSAGANTLLVKVTTGAAVIFMASSLFLAVNARQRATDEGSLFRAPQPSAGVSPSTPDSVAGDSVAGQPSGAASSANQANGTPSVPASVQPAPTAAPQATPTQETQPAPAAGE